MRDVGDLDAEGRRKSELRAWGGGEWHSGLQMGIAGTLKDGRCVDRDGKAVKESSGDQGRSGAEVKGARGEDRGARNQGVGGDSRRIGNRSADEGKVKGNVSSEADAERQKGIDRAREVIRDVCDEMYKRVKEAEGEAQAKAELARRYYERALAAERELEEIRKAGGASGRCGGGESCGRTGSTKGNMGSRGWVGKGQCGSKTGWCRTKVERGGGCWSRGLSKMQQRTVAKARSQARATISLGGSGKQEERRASSADTGSTSVCDKGSSGDSEDAISNDTVVFGSAIGDNNGDANKDDDTGQHGTTREGVNKGGATGQELVEDQLVGRNMQVHGRAGELLGKVEQRSGETSSGTSRDNNMKGMGSDSQVQDSGKRGDSSAALGALSEGSAGVQGQGQEAGAKGAQSKVDVRGSRGAQEKRLQGEVEKDKTVEAQLRGKVAKLQAELRRHSEGKLWQDRLRVMKKGMPKQAGADRDR